MLAVVAVLGAHLQAVSAVLASTAIAITQVGNF
jgi:hypothetical protein